MYRRQFTPALLRRPTAQKTPKTPLPTGPRLTQLDQLREHFEAGRYREALNIAVRFPQLGADREVIVMAQFAFTNPHLCGGKAEERQREGVEALRRKYKLKG